MFLNSLRISYIEAMILIIFIPVPSCIFSQRRPHPLPDSTAFPSVVLSLSQLTEFVLGGRKLHRQGAIGSGVSLPGAVSSKEN